MKIKMMFVIFSYISTILLIKKLLYEHGYKCEQLQIN